MSFFSERARSSPLGFRASPHKISREAARFITGYWERYLYGKIGFNN